MKTVLGVIACLCVLLSGCVSKTLKEPMPKHAKIGVMSLMGQAKFEPSNGTKAVSHQTNALKAFYRLRPYSHQLSGFDFDKTLTQSIAKSLRQKGYTQVAEIYPSKHQTPVKAVKAHPGLNYVVVISPDAGVAPSHTAAEANSDLVFGYGAYFQDKAGDHHTFGFAGYDVSVYDTQNLDIMASKYFQESTIVPYSKWTPNYSQVNGKTIRTLAHWLKHDVTQKIVDQVSATTRL